MVKTTMSRGKRMVELALKKIQCRSQKNDEAPAEVDKTYHNMENMENIPAAEDEDYEGHGPIDTDTANADPEKDNGDDISELSQDLHDPTPKKRRRTMKDQKIYHKDKYPLLEGCRESCRKKCQTKVTHEQRLAINGSYWSLSFSERRIWLDGHILVTAVKNRKHAQDQYSRSHALNYMLPVATSRVSVCKTMFLRTLGLKTDGIITEFVRCKTSGNGLETLIKDNRGTAAPKNKIDKEIIREHILSYHPQVSHYKLENAPNKRYLDPQLTITAMWEDYKSKHGDISYIVYQRVFQAENIGFGKPSQDGCEICATYDEHSKNIDGAHSEDCDQSKVGLGHKDKAKIARTQYHKDQDETTNEVGLFTVDMQKVILLPKMTLKEHFFVSRLVVFNETFASVKDDGDLFILWHEAIAGRLGMDVASTYIKCINLCEKDVVIFWADNCTGQNKNWVLYTSLCWCVNQSWGPQSITMKYFERGHTFMRADSVHGSIGRKMKKTPEICTFQDFVDLCDKSGSKIKPITLQYHYFYAFEDGHRNRKSKNVTLPILSSVCLAEFRKGSRSMWYKQCFEGDLQEVEFLKPKFNLDTTPATKNQPRGITGSKRDNIVKLVQSFPAGKRKFWQDIPVNDDNADLVQQFE